MKKISLLILILLLFFNLNASVDKRIKKWIKDNYASAARHLSKEELI
ncbi:hypothetical protein [Borreliella carolinensis]|uniref:Uncharacterized protein n=1 Tax=Borreliella carolinensis TaxID=478174 RepID=A0ACD5GLM7_9SPIR